MGTRGWNGHCSSYGNSLGNGAVCARDGPRHNRLGAHPRREMFVKPSYAVSNPDTRPDGSLSGQPRV